MKIHEYQAKDLLKQFNVPVPQGNVATTSREARQVAEELAEGPFVVKAQIHAGGRGKGGGIKVAMRRLITASTTSSRFARTEGRRCWLPRNTCR